MTHRKWLPAISELDVIEKRLQAGVSLDADDHRVVLELIHGIRADRDVRKKYWQTARGRPEKDWTQKLAALVRIAEEGPATPKLRNQLFERIANDTGLTFEAIEETYKKYMLPQNRAVGSRSQVNAQGKK